MRFSGQWLDTPVYALESLPGAVRLEGPAILEGATTTVVVHPGQTATSDAFGNVFLHFRQTAGPEHHERRKLTPAPGCGRGRRGRHAAV